LIRNQLTTAERPAATIMARNRLKAQTQSALFAAKEGIAASSLGLAPCRKRDTSYDASELDTLSSGPSTSEGGAVLARYRDPVGGTPLLLAACRRESRADALSARRLAMRTSSG
jgi:hypothetical protein